MLYPAWLVNNVAARVGSRRLRLRCEPGPGLFASSTAMDWQTHSVASYALEQQRKSDLRKKRQGPSLTSPLRKSPTRTEPTREPKSTGRLSHEASHSSNHNTTKEAADEVRARKKRKQPSPSDGASHDHLRGCCLCGSRPKDQYHECQDCSLILCSFCVINAPCAHPFPDHLLQLVHLKSNGSMPGRRRTDSAENTRGNYKQEKITDRGTSQEGSKQHKRSIS